MADERPPFDELLASFQDFLLQYGWSDSLLWVYPERLTCHRRRVWVLRPEELRSPGPSRVFYERARETDLSLKISALAHFGPHSLAYVHTYGTRRRNLNMWLPNDPPLVYRVRSRVAFGIRRRLNRLRKGDYLFAGETLPREGER